MTGVYKEIVWPERLVFTGAALDEKGEPIFEILNTVTFVQKGDKTLGMEEGWSQSLERLDEFVKEHLA
jgi:uncharacterized protein YndB with AHSA1/START domain